MRSLVERQDSRQALDAQKLLALYFLGLAAVVVVVIGWLGALVSGRLPRFAASLDAR
jgi:hypothetical protein